MVLTGDLLVNPISFALNRDPTRRLLTLEELDGPLADEIAPIPGHAS